MAEFPAAFAKHDLVKWEDFLILSGTHDKKHNLPPPVYLNVREYTVFYYNTSTERRCNHFIPGLFVSVICLLFEKIKCFFVLKTRDQVIF